MTSHFHYRIVNYLRLLREADVPLTSAEICVKMQIKPRTLRNDLSRYKAILRENGVLIHSRPGRGYQIHILDEKKYQNLISSIAQAEHRQHCIAPVYPSQRVNYIIRHLLSARDYIKLDELADEIYVSRATLNNCMTEVRRILTNFKLGLHSRSGYGLKITGNELNIRQAMAQYFFYDNSYSDSQKANQQYPRNKIADILTEALQEGQLKLTDTGFRNLIVHLEIALRRVNNCHDAPEFPEHYAELKEREEYRLSELLISRIEREFAVSFPEAECYFVAIHLAGKRSLLQHQAHAVSPDIVHLFDKINLRIFDDFAIDLSGDFELFHLLSLHLIPMMDRLHWDLKVNNPLLEDIKQENLKAFEVAVLAGKIIQQETGLEVNEDEIGYLAIHFGLAIERQGNYARRYNLLLVCASGMGSSQLLLYRIRQRFAHAIRELKVIQLYELSNFDLAGYDMILSTVKVSFQTSLPVLRVNYFFDSQDLNRMEHWMINDKLQRRRTVYQYFQPNLFFTDLHSTDRFQLLSELCQRVALNVPVTQSFESWVIEREKLSGTAFGYGIAFPHPLHPCGNRTFVAVAILKKPMRWDNHEVRYIFMINIRKGEQEPLQWLYESLISLMDKRQKLAALDTHPTFNTLMSLLIDSVTTEESPVL
ncbi:PRD domain-containing protein [Enterobacteriaceae bacterium BIT-l23]|uniref:BglG family transcription antiterminator n=1 Tax=Jejubacter sp. L23 TaxID=3092086 RepID=UPI001584D1DB|nr:PRD domain-containing protein [Enterobacteriaceae bacterium BIT-l23]